jgi:cell division transport system permease protein
MKAPRVAKFLLGSALKSFRHSWVTQTIAAATLAATFLVLGGALILFHNLRNSLLNAQGNMHVSVYFVAGQGPSSGREVSDHFCNRSFVKKCQYLSDEEAKNRFVDRNPEMKSAVVSLEANPFPSSMEIDLNPAFRDRQTLKNFVQEISKVSGVELVDDGWSWLDRWLTLLAIADWGMWTLTITLAGAMIFIVSNTIKLVVYARRDEVEILHLVGATPWMIRLPFLMEGFLQGLLGGGLALLLLYGMFEYVTRRMSGDWGTLLTTHFAFLPWSDQLKLLALGAAMGVIGSALAVGKFLRT